MDLAPLQGLLAQLPIFALVLARISAFLAVAPVLGGSYVPGQARALLAIAVSLILAPVIGARMAPPAVDAGFALLLIQEVMIGLSVGWIIDLTFQAVRMGGDLINRYGGFAAAENFDPSADIGAGPFGDLLHFAFILLFFLADGHHIFLAILARGYDQVPIGGFDLQPGFAALVSWSMDDLMRVASTLSFPVLGVILAITVAEGVMTRAVPQINIMHVSFAIKIAVSLLMLSAMLPAALALFGVLISGAHALGIRALTVL